MNITRPTWCHVWNDDYYKKQRTLVVQEVFAGYLTIKGGLYTNAEGCSPPKWWPKEWV